MKNHLRVSLLQSALHWEQKQANLDRFSMRLHKLAGQTDLVLLPEMFSTGFTMNAAALAETMTGPTLSWMARQAETTGAAIAGSFIATENGRYFNRLVFMQPDGNFHTYDKRHLFTLAGEHEHFTPGASREIMVWQGWKILPQICYDLRFPVWSRNTDHYDLLLYVANWPDRRGFHWRSLLTARAIENQVYTLGLNITGTDGNGLEYAGDSAITDYSGHTLVRVSRLEETLNATLDLESQQAYRQKLGFLRDRDRFEVWG